MFVVLSGHPLSGRYHWNVMIDYNNTGSPDFRLEHIYIYMYECLIWILEHWSPLLVRVHMHWWRKEGGPERGKGKEMRKKVTFTRYTNKWSKTTQTHLHAYMAIEWFMHIYDYCIQSVEPCTTKCSEGYKKTESSNCIFSLSYVFCLYLSQFSIHRVFQFSSSANNPLCYPNLDYHGKEHQKRFWRRVFIR